MSEDSGFRLTREMHLRRPQDFERVYGAGVRSGDDHLLVFVHKNELNVLRAGVSVSRKHGSAVHRNVKRRRLKEAFRLLQHELPRGLDLILIPRQRDDSGLKDYQASIKTLVPRLARRLQAQQIQRNAESGS